MGQLLAHSEVQTEDVLRATLRWDNRETIPWFRSLRSDLNRICWPKLENTPRRSHCAPFYPNAVGYSPVRMKAKYSIFLRKSIITRTFVLPFWQIRRICWHFLSLVFI
jgi:hypothetical protein